MAHIASRLASEETGNRHLAAEPPSPSSPKSFSFSRSFVCAQLAAVHPKGFLAFATLLPIASVFASIHGGASLLVLHACGSASTVINMASCTPRAFLTACTGEPRHLWR